MSKKELLLNTLKRQKQILESEGYKVAYISIYGSQNYGLDIFNEEYQSDIDMKAIIVPTLDELVRNSKPVSMTVETEWGQCDVKDIRSFFETIIKANPSYIETLFTQYHIVDPMFRSHFKEILEKREDLVETLQCQFVRAMYGMMCEKQKALCHPYPTIAHKIEKWGYDGKQLHHIARLYYMMEDYFLNRLQLEECFYPPNPTTLLDYKMNVPTLEEAKVIAEEYMEKGRKLRDSVLDSVDEMRIDYSIKNEFIALSQNMIKNKIIIDWGGFIE